MYYQFVISLSYNNWKSKKKLKTSANELANIKKLNHCFGNQNLPEKYPKTTKVKPYCCTLSKPSNPKSIYIYIYIYM